MQKRENKGVPCQRGLERLCFFFRSPYKEVPFLCVRSSAFPNAPSLWRWPKRDLTKQNPAALDDLKEYSGTLYTDGEFEEMRKKYDFARPFTKESLLYREIFEKYYPGQAEMVVDFWMPNRAWEGCDVDDPSARVLANYGTSGE